MSYLLRSAASPNHGAQTVPSPCRLVVLHWWGNPSGQDPWGVVGWLRNPASQVSAHYVIWPGNVVRLLDLRARSWANGHDWANANAITLECDPNNVPDTMTTVVDLLADLVRSGDLAPDFELRGHRDYYSTACPGAYYQWLPTIRDRVTDALANHKPIPTEEEELMAIVVPYIDQNGAYAETDIGTALGWLISNLNHPTAGVHYLDMNGKPAATTVPTALGWVISNQNAEAGQQPITIAAIEAAAQQGATQALDERIKAARVELEVTK